MNEKAKQRILEIDDNYSGDTRQFIAYLEKTKQEIGIEALQKWAAVLEAEGKAYSTINRRISAIKDRLRLLFSESGEKSFNTLEWFKTENSLKKMKKLKINSKAVDPSMILTQEELHILLNSSDKRMRIIMQFLYQTACRISEAINIKHSDVKRAREYILLRVIGKGKKERSVRISITLYNEINECFNGNVYLLENRNKNKFDRNYLGSEIKKRGLKYLKRTVTPHTFRHTFATYMIEKVGKTKAISKYLGHFSSAITQDMYNQEILKWTDLLELKINKKFKNKKMEVLT